MSDFVIECLAVTKTFVEANEPVHVLENLNLHISPHETVAILGSSGSGKSTLLHILGGLDKPTSGKVFVGGRDLANLSEKNLSQVRNQQLGFVYQFHHLLPEFSALENVCMPLLLGGMNKHQAKESAMHILAKIGLEARITHRPGQLSGGEKQRVAIARALVTKPKCILADEPTGNLDPHTAEKVYEATLKLNQELGTALIVVTHDHNLASKMQRCLTLENGALR